MVVELSTNEREDDLFGVLNEDGLYIREVAVDINLITAQRMGTMETYLPPSGRISGKGSQGKSAKIVFSRGNERQEGKGKNHREIFPVPKI